MYKAISFIAMLINGGDATVTYAYNFLVNK